LDWPKNFGFASSTKSSLLITFHARPWGIHETMCEYRSLDNIACNLAGKFLSDFLCFSILFPISILDVGREVTIGVVRKARETFMITWHRCNGQSMLSVIPLLLSEFFFSI